MSISFSSLNSLLVLVITHPITANQAVTARPINTPVKQILSNLSTLPYPINCHSTVSKRSGNTLQRDSVLGRWCASHWVLSCKLIHFILTLTYH